MDDGPLGFKQPDMVSQPNLVDMDRQPNLVDMDRQPNLVDMDRQPNLVDMDRQPNLVDMDTQPNMVDMDTTQNNLYIDRLNPTPVDLELRYLELPTRKWVDPFSFHPVPFIDPVQEALSKLFTGNRPTRSVLSLEQAMLTEHPYRSLIAANSWHAVAQLAKNDLISCHPCKVPQIMRLWYWRWLALTRLSFFDIVHIEADKLGAFDPLDLNYDLYPDLFPRQTGPMITFELQMLINNIPSFLGKHHQSLHKMYLMLYSQPPFQYPLSDDDRRRVIIQLANILVSMGQLVNATTVLSNLLSGDSTDLDILSSIGRLHLEIGDISAASKAFQLIEQRLGVLEEIDESIELPIQQLPPVYDRPDLVLSHRAYLCVAQGEFDAAKSYLVDLVSMFPQNMIAVNNLAVCQLLSGGAEESRSLMVSFLQEHPDICKTEPFLANLCLLYNLSDKTIERKKALVTTICQVVGHDFGIDCLKL